MGIVVIAIFAIVAVGAAIFWIGGKMFTEKPAPAKISAGQKLLSSPSAQTSIALAIRGPITAEEKHYDAKVTIDASARKLLVTTGYGAKVTANERLGNSGASFRDLLAALDRAGFMKSSATSVKTDGICAGGQLIAFSILERGKNVEDLWATSCGDAGSFAGDSSTVLSLILQQIPDAQSRIDDAKNGFANENSALFNL